MVMWIMSILVWFDTSFENSYDSYNLTKDIIWVMIHEGHED